MTIFWKKILLYAFGWGTTATTPFLVWQSQSNPTIGHTADTVYQLPAAPAIRDTTGSDWDDTYRTSEQSERTWYKSKPPQGVRIGCICMDDSYNTATGGGACAGLGGVRYWLYEQSDGGTIRHATQRHQEHPEALSPDELHNLRRAGKKKLDDDTNGFFDVAAMRALTVLAICITLAFVAKLWWANDNVSA